MLGCNFPWRGGRHVFVFPVNVDTSVVGYFPVSGDGIVLFESGKEMFGVAFLHILNSKTIDYE